MKPDSTASLPAAAVTVRILAGAATGRVFTYTEPSRFRAGREAGLELSLPQDSFLSRRHFALEITPPGCRLVDLQSKNGTYVDGLRYGGRKPLPPGRKQAPGGVTETLLVHGAEIEVGETRIRIELDGEEGEQPELDVEGRPTRIAGYAIEGELGRGGMGVVYAARRVQDGQPVALKTLKPEKSPTGQQVRSFLREVSLVRQLVHPHIVRLLDEGCESGILFYVQELIHGPDLASLVRDAGPLGLDAAIPIMLGCLKGLAHAHRCELETSLADGSTATFRGLVHRDLKPANVLLERRGDDWLPRIADFGLAKCYEAAGLTDMTRPGRSGGTPTFWPREQITHYRYLGPPTDVFSMAATFVWMMGGGYVRGGFEKMVAKCLRRQRDPEIIDFMDVITSHPPRPARALVPWLPQIMAEVLDRALQEEPVPMDESAMRSQLESLRFTDGAAFLDALERAVEQV